LPRVIQPALDWRAERIKNRLNLQSSIDAMQNQRVQHITTNAAAILSLGSTGGSEFVGGDSLEFNCRRYHAILTSWPGAGCRDRRVGPALDALHWIHAKLALAKFQLCAKMAASGVAGRPPKFPPGASLAFSKMESCVSETLHPLAPHHLPGFITAPGDTDTLMVVVGIVLLGAVLMVGNLYLQLHSLPERMAHKSQKLQFEIVAVLGLLALFTHNHLFWVIGLLLAMIDLPDFGTPLRSIAGSVEKIAGAPSGDEAAETTAGSSAHAVAAEGPATMKAGAAKSEVRSHA
jgi:hypothetical protein